MGCVFPLLISSEFCSIKTTAIRRRTPFSKIVSQLFETSWKEPWKKKSFDVNAFNKKQVEETKKPKKSRKQKENERRMKLIHGFQAEERISKWMKSLERPESSLNMKNFDVKDSFESNMQSNLSEKESVNFNLENFNAADVRESEALIDNLGMGSTKAMVHKSPL